MKILFYGHKYLGTIIYSGDVNLLWKAANDKFVEIYKHVSFNKLDWKLYLYSLGYTPKKNSKKLIFEIMLKDNNLYRECPGDKSCEIIQLN